VLVGDDGSAVPVQGRHPVAPDDEGVAIGDLRRFDDERDGWPPPVSPEASLLAPASAMLSPVTTRVPPFVPLPAVEILSESLTTWSERRPACWRRWRRSARSCRSGCDRIRRPVAPAGAARAGPATAEIRHRIPTVDTLDLAESDGLAEALDRMAPEHIVNPTAYTAVHKAPALVAAFRFPPGNLPAC
jgi:hypothetical protein